jgi:3-hydroxyisobutyrate dehydrogenase-like beta-hydroxyacid dehydrogenase
VGDVSVIGLGRMGSTLAGCLQEHGFALTVWNRSSERADTLVANGAGRAETPDDAFSASPVSLVCLGDGYRSLRELTGGHCRISSLRGPPCYS